MISALLVSVALAATQPGEGPRGGFLQMPFILPTSTGSVDVRLRMDPEADLVCETAPVGGQSWIDASAEACTQARAQAAQRGRPPMAMEMTIRSTFVATGEPAPALARMPEENIGTMSADVDIDAGGHVTRCRAVGEDRRICDRFTPDRVFFRTAPEGSPTRSGRLTLDLSIGGPMGEMIRRRRNGADD